MKQIPIYDESAPIACTIATEEIPARLALFERMRANLDRVERTEQGMLLHFPAGAAIEPELDQFVIDEKRCCQFWGFEVLAGKWVSLRWDGPPAAAPLLDELAAYFSGERPLTEVSHLF